MTLKCLSSPTFNRFNCGFSRNTPGGYLRLIVENKKMQYVQYLHSRACPKCYWSVSACGRRPLSASIVLPCLGSRGGCTFFWASLGRLFLPPSSGYCEICICSRQLPLCPLIEYILLSYPDQKRAL